MQTSIEWLVDKIKNQHLTLLSLDELQKQAKQMHKQEIKNAYSEDSFLCSDEEYEQYYNETFKKD